MAQDTASQSVPERADTVPAPGPVDAVLFDTLDARLTDITFYTAPDGALLATTPATSTTVRLDVTDQGLTGTKTSMHEYEKEDLTAVEHIDPTPEPDVATDADLRTRLRGD